MFRAIPTCTVFYPSDAVSTERAVELSANTKVGPRVGDRVFVLMKGCAPSYGWCFPGDLLHPHQQTGHRRHLLPR